MKFLIGCDALCQGVGRRKRQRTGLKKMDREEKQEHQKEDNTTNKKTDEDDNGRGKDLEHEICVITWDVNKSSAQCDFLCDMVQCQANVVMFQETQNWQDDGTAEELGWTLLKEQKDGNAAIAAKRKNMNLLRHSRRITRWVLVVLGSIIFLSMYTWGGEANLQEYYKTLKDLDKNMQEVSRKYHNSGIIAGMDAQVGLKPHQEPFVGGGTRVVRGNAAKYCELEKQIREAAREVDHETRGHWQVSFFQKLGTYKSEDKQAGLLEQDEIQLQKWKIIDYIAVRISWSTRSTVARDCRVQNLPDHRPLMTYVRLPHKKEGWSYENNSILKGWKPKTENDETGFWKNDYGKFGRCTRFDGRNQH